MQCVRLKDLQPNLELKTRRRPTWLDILIQKGETWHKNIATKRLFPRIYEMSTCGTSLAPLFFSLSSYFARRSPFASLVFLTVWHSFGTPPFFTRPFLIPPLPRVICHYDLSSTSSPTPLGIPFSLFSPLVMSHFLFAP